MNLGQIFEETMKTIANNDAARLEELRQIEMQKFALKALTNQSKYAIIIIQR